MKTSRSARACPSARFSTPVGKPEFREAETAALRGTRPFDRAREGRASIALGGGAFLSEENFEIVSNNGVSVWLDCPFSTVERRLAGYRASPAGARSGKAARVVRACAAPGYERADYCIPVEHDDAAATAAKILALPLF